MNLTKTSSRAGFQTAIALMISLAAVTGSLQAKIDGIHGPTFTLTAKTDRIQTGDGNTLLIWGYADGAARAQLPGPTLIVNEGDTVMISLTNNLAVPTSMVFPGQQGVTSSGGSSDGVLTREAGTGATVTYSFVASHPGTYLYKSGTNPDLQVEMGLSGALIVRPTMGAACAYNSADTCFDREYLFFESEMDPRIHDKVEWEGVASLAATKYLSDYFPNYWFLNGRNAPESMAPTGAGWLPTQPYGSMVRMHPHEKILMRVIGGNRDAHPFHHHGNHARVIAHDGRLLQTAAGAGADLSHQVFTIQTNPGNTVDAIFEWTGKDLGWDVFGTPADGMPAHACNGSTTYNPANPAASYDTVTGEYCPDHGKPFPVLLPESQNLAFGGFWSGSPFLGTLAPLPPGQGGLNPGGAFCFMWHSHTEKEMTNWDIFPGGLMTMLCVERYDVQITE